MIESKKIKKGFSGTKGRIYVSWMTNYRYHHKATQHWRKTSYICFMWTCPNCGREFKNTNQDHSCVVTDLESHFLNKQQNVVDTFEKIKDEVMKYKDVKINSVKNAILFTAKSHFLAVKPKKSLLDIEFVLDQPMEGFPIHKTAQASKNKWAHFVRLDSPEQVDQQLITWLRNAYEVCK
jgi:hypothetical protein